MSRIRLKPKDPSHEVLTGYDRPLSTFFITVLPVQDENDLRDLPAIVFKDRQSRSEVLDGIEQYAILDKRTKLVMKYIYLDLDPGPELEKQGYNLMDYKQK